VLIFELFPLKKKGANAADKIWLAVDAREKEKTEKSVRDSEEEKNDSDSDGGVKGPG